MKIIHCADLHLDSKMESNLDRQRASQRKAELFDTFSRMIEYGVENGVRLIIIAGDLFDTAENMQLRIKRRVLSAIKNAPEIDFLYIKGNHDSRDFLEGEELPENLKLFSEDWKSYEYGNTVVTGRDFTDELPEGGEEKLYSGLMLDSRKINIVVMHGQESGYSSGKKDGGIINLKLLKNKNIDYLALGHIHSYKYARLDKRGMYCYSGCLEGRGFDECGEKGFVLLDVNEASSDERHISCEFIPFAKRTLHEVTIKLSGEYYSEDELEGLICDKIKDIPEKDLVKVIISGETEENTDIDVEYLTEKFEKRFYFLKLCDDTKLSIKYEDYENDISLKGEFIRLVKEKRIREEDKREIILMGLKALRGREIDL